MIKKRRLKETGSNAGKTKAKIRPARIFIYALALAALSGGGYLLYDRIRRKKSTGSTGNETADTILSYDSTATATPKASRVKGNDEFPLKKGSRGTRVTQLQQALIKKGATTLKADGKFGTATASALKTAGYSDTVDEIIFNTITGIDSSTLRIIFNPAELARDLYHAANNKNEQGVLDVLRQIKSVSEYSSVNDYYKKQSLIAKTIVTHLLEYAFKEDEEAAGFIRNEFKRIGLRVNESGIWSLQGIQLYKDLITLRMTVVIDAKGNKIPVRRNVILGDEVKIENGMTWFRSVDRSILKVPTQDVKYA